MRKPRHDVLSLPKRAPKSTNGPGAQPEPAAAAQRARRGCPLQVQRASSTLMSGTPSTCTAHSAIGGVSRDHPAPRRRVAEDQAERRACSSAITIVPVRQLQAALPAEPLLAAGDAAGRAALDPVGVERPHRDPGLDQRHRERVVEQSWLLNRPARSRSSIAASAGGRKLVGVDADLAEEDPVGGRDRLAAQVQRPRRRERGRRGAAGAASALAGCAPGAPRPRASAGRGPWNSSRSAGSTHPRSTGALSCHPAP